MTITARSYCHVPRSYDQKNVRPRIVLMLAISVGGDAVDDDAVAHVHDAVEVSDGFRIVRDHHDRLTEVFVQLAQHLEHDIRIFRIEITRRLIGKQDFWLVDNRAGDRDSLLLTARKFGWLVMQP